MPKLKLVLDKLDEVAEPLRAAYTERDGKFYLDADVPDTDSLKGALDKERRGRSDLEKKLKAFGEFTPEQVADLVKKHEEEERRKAEGKGEWDKLKVQLVEQHNKVLGEEKTKRERLEGTIRTLVAENVARRELEAAGGVVDLLLPHVMKQVKVDIEESGEARAVVVDAKGTPRIGDGQGNTLSISALVGEMKKDKTYAPAFSGSGASGSGAPPSGGKAAPHLISQADARDVNKYRAAKAAAEKAGVELQYSD